MGRFGIYALYLVFNYYNNSETINNSNTTLVIKNNTIGDICEGELLDQNYKGIDCNGEIPFLQCCQKNVNTILNKSVEMNTCLNYSNNDNYTNMIINCEPNEHIFFEYLIVIGFSIIFSISLTYIFYRLYRRCFRNGSSYHYLNINEDIGRRYL
jgi:hypothetical protein